MHKEAFRNALYWYGAEIRCWEELGTRLWGDRNVAFGTTEEKSQFPTDDSNYALSSAVRAPGL